MSYLTDLANCFRPEPVGFGAFDNQDEPEEVHECSFCINRATRSVEFSEKGQRKHLFTCDECHVIEDWTGKENISISKL